MRLVRFRHGNRIATGAAEGSYVRPLQGTFFNDPIPTGEEVPIATIRLLSPILPSKVVAVGRNYVEHAEEMGGEVPEEPVIFLKPSTAVIGPDDPIPYPPASHRVDHEAELGVVIGRLARHVRLEDSGKYILGYVCANDVTARDLQLKDGQWTRGKGFDTFCPVGDRLVPVAELGDGSGLRVVQRLNGELFQDGNTAELVFGVRRLVAYASSFCTLEPGDLILTGTPSGVGHVRTPPVSMQAGDVVEIEIDGLGVLRNPVVAEGR